MLLVFLLILSNIFFVFTNFTINTRFHKRTKHVEIVPHAKSLIKGNYYTALIKLNLEYMIDWFFLSFIFFIFKYLFAIYGYFCISTQVLTHPFFIHVFEIFDHGWCLVFYTLLLTFYSAMLKSCYFTLNKNKVSSWVYLFGLFLNFFFIFTLILSSVDGIITPLIDLFFNWNCSEYAFLSFFLYKGRRNFSTRTNPLWAFWIISLYYRGIFQIKK